MSVRVTRTAHAGWQVDDVTCPVSRALAGTENTLGARLAGH